MNILLDTHAVLWYAVDSPKLSMQAKEMILSAGNQKFVSLASAWEVAIKNSKGKSRLTDGVDEFYRIIKHYGFLSLPIREEHIALVETLPFHHRDPFDRLLVATALHENLTIITADANIPSYDVPCTW